MRLTSTRDVFDLLESHYTAAALGAAFELGLFRLLERQSKSLDDIANALNIPRGRCRYWLQLLEKASLIEATDENSFMATSLARSAILEAHDHDTWAFLARESRDRLPAVHDLPEALCDPRSNWEKVGLTPPDYYKQMVTDAEHARRFTRMLYDLHGTMADELAQTLDLHEASSMIDVAGGSGVMTYALLRRFSHLTAVILDIPNVCIVGRAIALENGLQDRVIYKEIDLLADPLPTGFDCALKCDVGLHEQALYKKVFDALNPDGRLAIVDIFAPSLGVAPSSRAHWALQHSMHDPQIMYRTADEVESMLGCVGFELVDRNTFQQEWTIIEARRI